MGRIARIVWALIGVGALAGGGLWVRAALDPDGYELTAVFDDVGDLVDRLSVQVADVRIGEITGIELTDDYRARVTMRVDENLDVPEDTTAFLRTSSLLGEKFIELRFPTGRAAVQGPFLEPGDEIARSQEAPELEFVAETGIEVLSAIEAGDIATLINTGGEAFGGQRQVLRSLVTDLGTITGTLADRSSQLVRIIDELDSTAATLGGGSGALREALVNLAETTQILADNRDRTVEALDELSRLATSQNVILTEHFGAIETQIRQVDDIAATLVENKREVNRLLTWLERFVTGTPDVIPRDFTNVYQLGVLRGSEDD